MSVLDIDLVSLADGELTANGHKFTRRAIVTDPEPHSGRTDDAARIFEAMHDTDIPGIGDSHPDVANCLLTKIRCVAIESNWLQLDLIYETTQPNYQIITLGQDDISMESSLIQTETTKEWGPTGSAVSITPVVYTYQIGDQNPEIRTNPDGSRNNLGATLTVDSEQPVVPIFIPARMYVIRKRLAGTSEAELEALNDAYQGHVNNDTWRGYSVRKWLCMGITWRTTDRRTTYNIEVRFRFKFDTFDAEIVFRDPNTGKVPNDVFNQGNAYRRDRIQREANFTDLLNAIGV